MKTLVLNDSEQQKTVRALKRAAAKATGKARRTIQGLSESLKTNPTKPGTGRATPKGETMAKKKSTKARATKRKANPTNPTRTRRRSARKVTRRRRVNPSAMSAMRGIDVMGILTEGGSIVGGELAQSFVQKQVTNFLPSMSGLPASLISGGLIAGASLYFGKGNKILRGIAIGAVAGTLRGLAKSAAPSLFAGAEEEIGAIPEMPTGYIDPNTGQWVSFLSGPDDEISGVIYDENEPEPAVQY